MKKSLYFFFALSVYSLASFTATAQDEGKLVVQQRFERSKSLYFSFGPALTLGKNIGDYSTGLNLEVGMLWRVNKLLSIGPSVSFLTFAYDKSKTDKYYYDYDDYYERYYVANLTQTGGNLNLISAGANFKLNFIPVSDDSKFSLYGIVNPFVSYYTRSAVHEHIDEYDDYTTNNVFEDPRNSYDVSNDDYPALKATSKVSGGAHLGVGFEFMPAKKVSFFGQATFSYTLPVNYISTGDYVNKDPDYTLTDDNGRTYYDASTSLYLADYPIVKKGFSTVSLKFGIALNF